MVVRGNLEQDADSWHETPLLTSDFPRVLQLKLEKDSCDKPQKIRQLIEELAKGDTLRLSVHEGIVGSKTVIVLNHNGKKLGSLSMSMYGKRNDRLHSFIRLMQGVKATVETIVPVSAKRKGAKYPDMDIRLEYVGQPKKPRKQPPLGNYLQTEVCDWPPVCRILSVFDAVIGVTESGEVYYYGFSACTDQVLRQWLVESGFIKV